MHLYDCINNDKMLFENMNKKRGDYCPNRGGKSVPANVSAALGSLSALGSSVNMN